MFQHHEDVAKFVNVNNIKKENILNICAVALTMNTFEYTIFFYGDSSVKEISKGFFGW